MKLLRRLTNKSFGSTEESQETDELVKLDGVTVPISAALVAEGINSIDELVGADPVLLALRTGIPFPSILRFGSQAVVWIHLDDRAGELVRIGLGNAYLITKLVEDLEDTACERRAVSQASRASAGGCGAGAEQGQGQAPSVPSAAA